MFLKISGKLPGCPTGWVLPKLFSLVLRLMRIFDDKGYSSDDGIAVNVIDEGTGRYKLETVIPWPGETKLIAELMHPSEAVVDLAEKTSPFHERKDFFLGTYPSEKKSVCDVMLR